MFGNQFESPLDRGLIVETLQKKCSVAVADLFQLEQVHSINNSGRFIVNELVADGEDYRVVHHKSRERTLEYLGGDPTDYFRGRKLWLQDNLILPAKRQNQDSWLIGVATAYLDPNKNTYDLVLYGAFTKESKGRAYSYDTATHIIRLTFQDEMSASLLYSLLDMSSRGFDEGTRRNSIVYDHVVSTVFPHLSGRLIEKRYPGLELHLPFELAVSKTTG